ncbi:MAG TPA: NAD(P)H-dependent oxidoreductase [Mesorhizobium sp.]|jgi:NAD(P)H dehydrogenase (quinone)
MRVLVVYAHPVETSLAAALHRAVVDALTEAGHQVDDCDLYAEGFQPALTRAERLDYHDTSCNRAAVDTYVERLLDAEAFVVVCPVWNFGFPAILKGYFDRVFLPGVSFRLENGAIYPNLTNIKRVIVVTTYGARRWRAFLMGDPPRRIAKRVLRSVFRTLSPVSFLALYDLNNATPAICQAFVDRVRRKMLTL